MTNRAPIARAGFSAGSASDYLRLVRNDAISIRSGRNGVKGLILTSTNGEVWTPLSDTPNIPNLFTDILSGPDGKLIIVATAGIFISRT